MPLNATRTEQGIVVLNSFWQQSHLKKKKKEKKREREKKKSRMFFLSPVINDFFFYSCWLQSKRFVCCTAKWGNDVTVSRGACVDAFRGQENELRGLFLCAAVHGCCNTPTFLGTRFWCSTTNFNLSVCGVTRQITRPGRSAAITALIEQPLLHLRTHFISWTPVMVDYFFFPPWDWIVVYRFRNATSACSIRLWHIKQQSLYYKEHAVNVSGV